jgi:hypothetical protein
MILLRPWPGLTSSRALINPKDSRSETSLFTAFRSRPRVAASSETGAGFSRTAWITRTRCDDSTRIRSAGSSKVNVISGRNLFARSSFRAGSKDRPVNASTEPDETITRGDVFLAGFATFFIFFPPQFLDLLIEQPGQALVSGELYRLLRSHGVPVSVAMAVVVSEHPAVVRPTDGSVDARKAVLDDLPIQVLPHFFLQHRPTPRPLQVDRVIHDLPNQPAGEPFLQSPA